MSIWDDIAKGMSDAASFTVKKTGEFTNIAKMKYAIHSEEAKLSECFEEIGKLYYAYQREGTDYVSEIAALIAEADMIKLTIKEMKEELAKMQNNTVCKGCGAKIDAAAAFCPVCGAKQAKDEADSADTCGCGCGCDADEADEHTEE